MKCYNENKILSYRKKSFCRLLFDYFICNGLKIIEKLWYVYMGGHE